MSDSAGGHDEPGTEEEHAKHPPALLAPEDFYYENGLLVFTAVYHLKRGYCCNSGCRHCPFR
jgi:hypothetical protein